MYMNDKHKLYENYSVEDFATDPDFVQWVKRADPQDNEFWKAWLNKHPHKRVAVEEARALVLSMTFLPHPDAQEATQNIWERINATNRQQAEVPPVTLQPTRTAGLWWKAAAAITGVLLLAGAWLYTSYSDKTVSYQTSFGETHKIVLPDSSVVTLNANSKLTLGQWEGDREVWLQGEAFFSVRKKKRAPGNADPVKFIVHTNTLDVNVLGTEFTVSERSDTRVVLNTGKIALTLPDKTIMMKPGDMVEISGKKKQPVQRTVDPRVYSAWKDNEWILDGLSLEKIAQRIEETYGLKVVIKKNPDPNIEVTGVVPTDNLDTLLKALSAAFNLTFKQEGKEVLIE
jgi:ferric-dicitrate binding protein FerR (iron transport regulator)